MEPNHEVMARHRGLVVLRTVAAEYEPATSKVELLNLGEEPVFVHDGIMPMSTAFGGAANMSTRSGARVLAPGHAITLFPTSMFDNVMGDEHERNAMGRRLRHDAPLALQVRLSFSDTDFFLVAKMGSVHNLLMQSSEPLFSLQDVMFMENLPVED